MKKTAFFMVMVTLLSVCLVPAQTINPRLQGQMNTFGGLHFETWSAKSDRITQIALPITYVYPINPRARIDVITSPAFTTFSNNSLNGLSDIRIRGHYLTKDERYVFTYGLVLPTGKNQLTTEEFNVATAMSVNAFNFRVPYLGQGRDVNLGMATAWEYGNYIIGAGVSFLHKDNYKPFKSSEYDYDPGNELTLTTGIERNVFWMDRNMRVTADIVYTLYGSDTGNGEEVFKSGNRFIIQGTLSAPMDNFDLLLFVRDRIKGKNKTGTGDIFEAERKNRNGNEFQIMGKAIFPPNNGQRFSGLVDFKLYSNNAYGTNGAMLLGLGGGYQRPLDDKMTFDGGLAFYFGSINSSGESTGVTGIKLDAAIRYFFH